MTSVANPWTANKLRHLAVFLLVGCLVVASNLGAVAAAAEARDFRARVVYVDDGDTVVLLTEDHTQVKTRLASIDAPESSHTHSDVGRVGQPFSQNSKRFLEALVKGKEVRAVCYEQDRYGRSVCDMYVGLTNVNFEMVRNGWAWANTSNKARYLRDKSLPAAQGAAEAGGLGLWAGRNPVPPWEWRKRCWERRQCDRTD